MKEKVCPMLLAGLLGNSNIDVADRMISINTKSIEHLPKCLREECELWERRPSYECSNSGRCGLGRK